MLLVSSPPVCLASFGLERWKAVVTQPPVYALVWLACWLACWLASVDRSPGLVSVDIRLILRIVRIDFSFVDVRVLLP